MTTEAPFQKLFQQAVQTYKNGDRNTARTYMRQVLLENPKFVSGWLWMSALVDDVQQQRECLVRALTIDPTCEPAIKGLDILRLHDVADSVAHQMIVTGGVAAPVPKDDQDASDQQVLQLGEYLVAQGFIDCEQLDEALEEQRTIWRRTQGKRVPLGNILINMGVLTPQKLATALVAHQQNRLQAQERRKPEYLGEYLVTSGLISPQQLEAALAQQMEMKQEGAAMRLGDLLIYAGYITPEALDNVLQQQREEILSRFGT